MAEFNRLPHQTIHWLPYLPDTAAEDCPIIIAHSLTATLRRFDAIFSVKVVQQGKTEKAWFEEADLFVSGSLYYREVFLCLNDTAVVWARSVCHETDSFWRQILDCGTRPLGEQLFESSLALERSPFSFALIPPGNIPTADTAVWARRSRFLHKGSSLLLTECFLPALSAYSGCGRQTESFTK